MRLNDLIKGIEVKELIGSSNLNINSVEVVNNLSDLKKYNKKLVIFGSGLLTKEQLFSFKEEYNLCKFEIEGALFFDV